MPLPEEYQSLMVAAKQGILGLLSAMRPMSEKAAVVMLELATWRSAQDRIMETEGTSSSTPLEV